MNDPAHRLAIKVEDQLTKQGRVLPVAGPVQKSEEEWKKQLPADQYRVLRLAGTERAFTGKYWNTKEPGVYRCAGCGEVLFRSDDKFDSGCGWPSFNSPAYAGKIEYREDNSLGMARTEVVCARCKGHLGHVFNDAPEQETGLRYCINSASIEHDDAAADASGQTQPPAP